MEATKQKKRVKRFNRKKNSPVIVVKKEKTPLFSIRNRIGTYWHVIVLLLLSIILLTSHTLYVIGTQQFPEGGLDEPVYLEDAIKVYDILRHPTIETPVKLFTINPYRQPLYSIYLAVPLLLFGTFYAYKWTLWVNIVFYVATISAIYLLGREFMGKKASFLAAYIFAFYGFPLFYLHFTYSETATTFFVIASLLFLKRTQLFSDRKNTVIFSLFFLTGILTRWVVPIFVAGPFLLTVTRAVSKVFTAKSKTVKPFILNVLLFISVGIIPALLMYYLPHSAYFKNYISGNVIGGSDWAGRFLGNSELRNATSIRSVMFYLNILSQQTIYFWVLFVLGFLLAVIKFKKYAFFIVGFVSVYSIFTFGSAWKSDRFIVPIYPLMALISAVTIEHTKNRFMNTVLVGLVLILSAFNFLGASWGIGPFGKQGLKDIVLPEFIHHPRRIYLTTMVLPPLPNEANIYRIIDTLKRNWGNNENGFTYIRFFDMSQLNNGFHTVFCCEQRGIGTNISIFGIEKDDYNTLFTHIGSVDYILVKNGTIDRNVSEGKDKNWDENIYFIRSFNRAIQNGAILPDSFLLIAKIPIPIDNSSLRIYRRTRLFTKKDWQDVAEFFKKGDQDNIASIETALAQKTEVIK